MNVLAGANGSGTLWMMEAVSFCFGEQYNLETQLRAIITLFIFDRFRRVFAHLIGSQRRPLHGVSRKTEYSARDENLKFGKSNEGPPEDSKTERATGSHRRAVPIEVRTSLVLHRKSGKFCQGSSQTDFWFRTFGIRRVSNQEKEPRKTCHTFRNLKNKTTASPETFKDPKRSYQTSLQSSGFPAEGLVNQLIFYNFKKCSQKDTNQLAQINDASTPATQSSPGCSPATPGAARTTNWRSGSECGWNASTTTFCLQNVQQHAEQHPGADGMPGRYFNPQQVQHHQLLQQQLYMQQQQQRGGNGGINGLGIPNGRPQDSPWNLMGPSPGIPQPHQNMLHAPPGLRPPTGILSQFHRRQEM